MVFSSMTFLCVFFPVVFALYYILPGLRARNVLLILASLLFYAYGEPAYVLLMIFSIVMNYFFGRMMNTRNAGLRKAALLIAVVINIGLLVVFKYTDMILRTINQLAGTQIPMTEIALPIGISFFTFQALSYVIDVYRDEVQSQKSVFNVMLYVSFFPQLIAGPIVKYHDIQKQIETRKTDVQEIAEGFRRFTIGLAKKVLISNTVAIAADGVFNSQIGEINIVAAWIGAISYMLQIYYDFSGYSDMAIGMGHMFGFHFQENFNYPYISASIKEFWRRWHISLSTWFKEYLYIPLGGNRKGKLRTCVNKMVVFSATGLWHGASWNFVCWGLLFFVLLTIEKLGLKNILDKYPALGHLYIIFIIPMSWMIFALDKMGDIKLYFAKLFPMISHVSTEFVNKLDYVDAIKHYGIFFVFAVIFSLSIPMKIFEKYRRTKVASVILIIIFWVCVYRMSTAASNPFLYFRF